MNVQAILAELSRSPELAAVLARPFKGVDVAGLPRALRRRVEAKLRRRGLQATVRDAIHLAESPADGAQLIAWVEGLAASAARVAPATLAPGQSEAEVRAWALHHHVADLLDLTCPQLVGRHSALWYAPRELRVIDALVARGGIAGVSASVVKGLAQDLQRELEARAAVRRKALVAERAAEAWRGIEPSHPRIAAMWRRVAQTRARFRAELTPEGKDAAVRVFLDEEQDYVVLTQPSITRDALFVPFDGGELRASADLTSEQTLAAIDRALDLLTAPADAGFREKLASMLDEPQWARDLRYLDQVLAPVDPSPEDDKKWLGWRVVVNKRVEVEPLRCRPKKTGAGFVTRKESVHDLPLAWLGEPADRLATHLLTSSHDRGAHAAAVEALIGHPRVFTAASGNMPVPVRAARFELGVRQDARGIHLEPKIDGEAIPLQRFLALCDAGHGGERLVIVEDARVRVATLQPSALDVLRVWARRDRPLAPEALPALLQRLPALSERLPVVLDDALVGETVPGDPRPLLRLTWEDGGLDVAVRVRPLPEVPAQLPGEGPERLFAVRGGAAVSARRTLADEPTRVRAALARVGLSIPEGFDLRMPGLDASLALIEALQGEREAFQVEFSGDLPTVRGAVAASDLRLRIDRGRDWFGLNGVAAVDGHEVPLNELLAAVEEGRSFVTLGDGAWARIGDALRGALQAAVATTPADRGGARRLSPLHAPLVEALAEDGAEVVAPKDWLSVLDRLREARGLQAMIPPALRAELRDYQRVGFRWLASLAHWAPGAILADDMGLGKTVQAIALLLHRASTGPALVVAPTSVVRNWERELARFAPSLRVVRYHGAGRDGLLDGLAAGDVVITSYALLARDAAALAALHLATTVLDEAQAIKNALAQRSKAAHGLSSGFTLGLSGTPIENHLGELWSLFQAVAPGLLGSWGRFSDRFAAPIEGRGDRERRAQLARLIQPFVLRRTKREVATELPPRVDAVIDVDLAPAERVLYDQARMNALARVSDAGPQARFQILRELTRLRQLACHPRLVDASSVVPSSKLKQVLRVLEDLRDNGHQALVFSQFTRHLALVREALAGGLSRVAYLDGTMSGDAREAEVQRFQRGEADVFLISLGAGGTGLNLTAASYVLHLDPWWNPAKEDQASDRAHRIGQDKAVTVYRFVSRGTIEEQILALHAEKRELADALLEGTGEATRASSEDLLALLSEASEAPISLDDPLEFDEEEAPAVVPPAPTPPPVVAPVPANAVTLDALEEALVAQLDAEAASGAIARSSASNYARTARSFVSWMRPEGPVVDAEALRALGERFVAAARADATGRASDKVNAPSVLKRLSAALAALAAP